MNAFRRCCLVACGALMVAVGCSSTSTTSPGSAAANTGGSATSQRPSTSNAGGESSTSEDPFAPPAKTFDGSATTVSIAVGTKFGINLAQDPAGGSWNFSQKSGPVMLVSGGSKVGDDGKQTQTFTLKATDKGSEDLEFTYSDGTPPGQASPVTFHVTVT